MLSKKEATGGIANGKGECRVECVTVYLGSAMLMFFKTMKGVHGIIGVKNNSKTLL
jgi:hypothetical protein